MYINTEELKKKLDPSHFFGASLPSCLENTRRATLQELHEWTQDLSSHNIFLLYGGAGTGKSTIATTIAGAYRRKGQLGCHLFFTRGKSNPNTALRTIAYHLAEYCPIIARSIDSELKKSGVFDTIPLGDQLEILFHRPLSSIISELTSPILVVLDAIDECCTLSARRELTDVLRKDIPVLPLSFRFLITGRPEEDILSLASS